MSPFNINMINLIKFSFLLVTSSFHKVHGETAYGVSAGVCVWLNVRTARYVCIMNV
jgi:hypothetical protein